VERSATQKNGKLKYMPNPGNLALLGMYDETNELYLHCEEKHIQTNTKILTPMIVDILKE